MLGSLMKGKSSPKKSRTKQKKKKITLSRNVLGNQFPSTTQRSLNIHSLTISTAAGGLL